MRQLVIYLALLAGVLFITTFRQSGPALAQDGPKTKTAAPITSGKLVEALKVYDHSPRKDGARPSEFVREGRVEVYDQFVIVIHANGTRSLFPHGWYSNLRFKPD